MASRTSKLLEKLKIVLEGLENDLFDEGSNKMYYNGIEFTRSEWRNVRKSVDKVINTYENNNKSSQKFIKSHKEYTRTARMILYYQNKPVKTQRDYVRLEQLQRKMEKYLDKLDEERKAKTKLNLIKKQIEREKRRELTKERSIEDEFGNY